MTEPSPDAEAAAAGLQGENSGKVRGRPFVKGKSGNPNGRRKGAVSPTAALKRALTCADADRIARSMIDAAADGDLQAAKLVFDRIDGGSSSPLAVAVARSDGAPIEAKEIDFAAVERELSALAGVPLRDMSVAELRRLLALLENPNAGDGEARGNGEAEGKSVGENHPPCSC